MTTPGFQDMMLPVLRITADGQEHRLRNLVQAVADHFGLSSEERAQVLPSGQQTVTQNRVAWARTYLVKASLLESTRRGYVRITETGRQLLARKPSNINVAYLRDNYPVIREFIAGSSNAAPEPSAERDGGGDQTPEETLERAYLQLRNELAEELLAQVKELSPLAFERLVVELLVKMGYGGTRKDAGRAVGQSSDGGIDAGQSHFHEASTLSR